MDSDWSVTYFPWLFWTTKTEKMSSWKSWIVTTEALWPRKPKILTICSCTDKIYQHMVYENLLRTEKCLPVCPSDSWWEPRDQPLVNRNSYLRRLLIVNTLDPLFIRSADYQNEKNNSNNNYWSSELNCWNPKGGENQLHQVSSDPQTHIKLHTNTNDILIDRLDYIR